MIRAIFLTILMGTTTACASAAKATVYDGRSAEPLRLETAVETVRGGEVIVLGEQHGYEPHHDRQRAFLRRLGDLRPNTPVSVGLEFFERRYQDEVDAFLDGRLGEEEFLERIGWGATPFDHYRAQALFPAESAGRTLALNASRELTSKIAESGIESLNPAERSLLPEGFELGNPRYFERFRLAMRHHVPEEKLENYFEAQSVWDDVMAATAAGFLEEHPGHILVIIVGDFHTAYGGGLPARLRARGIRKVRVLSQTRLGPEETPAEAAAPHPRWGVRGDWIGF